MLGEPPPLDLELAQQAVLLWVELLRSKGPKGRGIPVKAAKEVVQMIMQEAEATMGEKKEAVPTTMEAVPTPPSPIDCPWALSCTGSIAAPRLC